MGSVKNNTSSAAVIGDVVSSRSVGSRAGLHRRLQDVLATINEQTSPVDPLRITVGDEFQGVYADLGGAVAATLLLRLGLLPMADLRHGIGWGSVTILDSEPRVEDGPGWWAAREAIEEVKRMQGTAALRGVRTWFCVAEGETATASPDVVNAGLLTRDHLVSDLSERSRELVSGLLAGHTQTEMAQDLGISASAVSQRVRNDGLGVLVAAHQLWLGEGVGAP